MCTVVSKSGASAPSYKFEMVDLQLELLNHSVFFFSFRGSRLAAMSWNATMYTENLAHKNAHSEPHLEKLIEVFQRLCWCKET